VVLHVLHAYKTYRPDVTGGVAQVIGSIVAATQDFENEVLVARSKGRGRVSADLGARVEAVCSFGEFWSLPVAPTYPLAFFRLARTADLVVQHSPFPLADLALLLPRPKRTKLIVYWHADIVRTGLVAKAASLLSAKTLQEAARIVVSHETVIQNSAILRRYEKKCTIIPFSVEASYWSILNDAERTRSCDLRRRFSRLIVALGRLVSYKGFDVLIEAMRSIDGQLIIIGSGALQAELKERIQQTGLQDRVFLKGHVTRDEIKTTLHAARVFAFPSLTPAEAFGLAQLEAMAVGLPVVNTRLPTGVPHIARDGLEALTVTPGSPRELADALTRLLDDPQLAIRLGAAGSLRAQEEYSPERFAGRTRRLINDVLQGV
jgi:glycosyltransferase involved in cell wall biosynthesis